MAQFLAVAIGVTLIGIGIMEAILQLVRGERDPNDKTDNAALAAGAAAIGLGVAFLVVGL